MFTHLVSAAVGQARASHGGTSSDDARLLAHMEALLDALRAARGRNRDVIAMRVRACELELAQHLERSGRALMADALMVRALEGESIEP